MKWNTDGFIGISQAQWDEAYGRWQLIKEMGCQNRMIFYPNGKIGYQSNSPEEEAIVSAALDEWNRRKGIIKSGDTEKSILATGTESICQS